MRHVLASSVIAAATFGVISLQAASAADMPAPVYKAAPPAWSWTGCYVGVQVGYGWGRTRHDFDNGAPSDTSNTTGALGGGHLGCNYQTANIVFGVEGDIEGANLNGTFTNLTGITSTGSARMKADASVRGRVGVAFDRSLLYATGGWAWARFDFGGGPAPAPPCCGYSANETGWTAGAGWQYAFTNNLSGRVEYRYTDFRSVVGPLPPTFPGVNMPTKSSFNAIRAGLSLSFGPR